jgi:tetratricopeptide (TPR) repeat protein
LQDLAASLEIDDAQVDLYLLRSEVYQQRGAPQLAANDVLRLAELTVESDKRFAYYVTAGDLYEQANFPANAVSAYREALTLSQDSAVSEKLANNAISAGDYKLAVETFTDLIDAETEADVLARLYFGRGRARAAATERIRAIEDFTLAINNRATFAEAYNARALAYLDEGREQSLIVADFEKAKEHGDNRYPDPYLNLGNLYYDLNEWVPARSNYVSYQETLALMGLPADTTIQQRIATIDAEIDTVSRRQREDLELTFTVVGGIVAILGVIGGGLAWLIKRRG